MKHMAWTDYDSQTCSIARTMQVIGERWTMLILRDLFQGLHRFEELRQHLRVPRDVLTKRLTTLVDARIIERVAYQEPGARLRHEYRLTATGRDLRIALNAILNWGDRHLAGSDGPPVRVTHADCGAAVHAQLVCDAGHVIEDGTTLRTEFLPGARLAG
jgi:DNA-binding HxlR family transcriptional regulator